MPDTTSKHELPGFEPLRAALKTAHRSVIALLVVCLVVIVSQGIEGDEPAPDRTLATLGIGLGLLTIVFRRIAAAPRVPLQTGLFLSLAALVTSAALGGLGVFIAAAEGGPETGLLFTVAGLIFAMRPAAHGNR